MTDNEGHPLNAVTSKALRDPNAEVHFICETCGEHLPQEDVEIRTEDAAAVAAIDCPECGGRTDIARVE